MPFSGDYALTEVGYRLWQYVPNPISPLTYTTEAGRRIVMDKPFETDGASVPRVFWSLPGFDPMDWPRAAILHDALWEMRYTGKLGAGFFESNRLLREALRSLGWNRLIAWSVHRAIDLFGWYFWLKGERPASA